MTADAHARVQDKAQVPDESHKNERAEQLSRQHNGPESVPAPGSIKSSLADATRTLEGKGTLPGMKVDHQTEPPQKKDWTIAVHLAGTLPGDKDRPQSFGAERQLEEMKRLAKETEGKSVNFVVHAERLVDNQGNLCEVMPHNSQKADCFSNAVDAHRERTERYFIHDGKIEELPEVKYKTAEDNLAGLLKDAGKLAPADKIGLFVQSHGVGSDGLDTNQGKISLKHTVAAIENGLKGSGHDKLDILDFNACDMGTAKVLDQTGKVAKDVVASAAAELATNTNDAQNMPAAFRALMDNSKMSGKELGEKIVQQSSEGKSGEGLQNAVKTLANFDMDKYVDFKKELDRFGSSLADASLDPANLRVIKGAIDKTTVPESGAPDFEAHDRDVKHFANNILEAVRAGKFKGDTSGIEQSANDLLKSYDSMATAQFGEKTSKYDQLGGLTVHLPGKEITDSRETARLLSPFNQISAGAKQVLEEGVQYSDRPKLIKSIDMQMKEIANEFGPMSPRNQHAIAAARHAIEKAKSDAELTAGLKALQKAGEAGEASGDGRRIRPVLRDAAEKMQEEYRAKSGKQKLTPGWDALLDKLYRHMS